MTSPFHQRITIEPGECGGKPCIRGVRIRVSDVLELLANRASIEEILDKATPCLEIADFRGGAPGFHGQVGTFGFPVVADLGEDGGSGPEERGFVWEGRGDAGASLDFLVEPFAAVGRSAPPMGGRNTEGRESLREIGFDPVRELRRGLPMASDQVLESLLAHRSNRGTVSACPQLATLASGRAHSAVTEGMLYEQAESLSEEGCRAGDSAAW
jgi:hypothetical protein